MDNTVNNIPLRGARKMIADKMLKSVTESAQLTHHAECDITALLQEKNNLKKQGINVSVEDIFIHILVQTLNHHSDMNATINNGEIQQWQAINISVAIALPDNLLAAPAIFDVGKLSLLEINEARKDLVFRAKKINSLFQK